MDLCKVMLVISGDSVEPLTYHATEMYIYLHSHLLNRYMKAGCAISLSIIIRIIIITFIPCFRS